MIQSEKTRTDVANDKNYRSTSNGKEQLVYIEDIGKVGKTSDIHQKLRAKNCFFVVRFLPFTCSIRSRAMSEVDCLIASISNTSNGAGKC